MVDLSALSVEAIEAKVQERLDLVIKIMAFAETITQERGEVVRREVYDSHTHIVRELKDFGGFRFRCDLGQSVMGGNTIEVWHDFPPSEHVFSASYNAAPDECEVAVFRSRDGKDWLSTLLHRIDHKDEVIAQIEQAKREEEAHQRRARETAERKTALLKRAKELMLSS